MNLKILQWLLKHREALLRVVEIAKKFDRASSYLAKWAVANEIAQIVLPILEAETVKLSSFDGPVLLSAEEYGPLMVEYSALGVDWKVIVDVVIPILIAILQAVASK
jgi:hypothetical protein